MSDCRKNLFCPNNASESYIFISWWHQKSLLVDNQLKHGTFFLFEIKSEDICINKLKSQLKLLPSSKCALGYHPSTLLKKKRTPSSVLCSPNLKSANCASPPSHFYAIPSSILVFCDPPPSNRIFTEPAYY